MSQQCCICCIVICCDDSILEVPMTAGKIACLISYYHDAEQYSNMYSRQELGAIALDLLSLLHFFLIRGESDYSTRL